MGEAQGRMFEPTFERAVKVEASDCRLTSDAGANVLREFDYRLQRTAAIAGRLHDPRDPALSDGSRRVATRPQSAQMARSWWTVPLQSSFPSKVRVPSRRQLRFSL